MLENDLITKIMAQEGLTSGKYLTEFQRKLLQKKLMTDISDKYKMRLQIMLLADLGKTQTEIIEILECAPATVRHWMLVAASGKAHNWESSPLGRPKAVNQKYLQRLKELASQSPRECGYFFRRWTANWLSKHLAKEFGIEVSDRHINRLLKEMGLSTRNKPVVSHSQTEKEQIRILDLPQDLWQKLSFNTSHQD